MGFYTWYINLGGYSSIGRTAICGIVYPCSSQGTHPLYIGKDSYVKK
jgi:hypothetical protein